MSFDKKKKIRPQNVIKRWFRSASSRWEFLLPIFGLASALLGGVGTLFYHGGIDGDGLSSIQPYYTSIIDESLVGKVHFNNEIGEAPFSKLFCTRIAAADKKIEGAMFSFFDPPVHAALEESKASGKTVGLVIDGQRKKAFSNLIGEKGKIRYEFTYSETNAHSRMHHKFFVFDSGTKKAQLLFGSSNLTQSQDLYDPGYIFDIVDEELSREFSKEFGRLQRGVRGRQKFDEPDYRPFACLAKRGNGNVELWLSPGIGGNSFKQRLIEILSAAKSKIDIMMWRFTDRDLANLIVAKANSGVRVRMVVDDECLADPESAIFSLQENKNISIVTDAWRTPAAQKHNAGFLNFNPYMHYHVAIIDEYVIAVGSSNWTYAGFYSNDEANIVSTIDWMLDAFRGAFELYFSAGSEFATKDQ